MEVKRKTLAERIAAWFGFVPEWDLACEQNRNSTLSTCLEFKRQQVENTIKERDELRRWIESQNASIDMLCESMSIKLEAMRVIFTLCECAGIPTGRRDEDLPGCVEKMIHDVFESAQQAQAESDREDFDKDRDYYQELIAYHGRQVSQAVADHERRTAQMKADHATAIAGIVAHYEYELHRVAKVNADAIEAVHRIHATELNRQWQAGYRRGSDDTRLNMEAAQTAATLTVKDDKDNARTRRRRSPSRPRRRIAGRH